MCVEHTKLERYIFHNVGNVFHFSVGLKVYCMKCKLLVYDVCTMQGKNVG